MGVAVRMPPPRRFTIEEYLTIERKAETKSEFHRGQILAMAGGMPSHNSIAPNISSALAPQLKGRCRIFNSDQRIAEAEAIYYPDVSVICGEVNLDGRHQDVIRNPTMVVEVLSRSTARYDRMIKLPEYQRTPTISDILLVAQDRIRIEHVTRILDNWRTVTYTTLTDVIDLPYLKCTLALADVYEGIEF